MSEETPDQIVRSARRLLRWTVGLLVLFCVLTAVDVANRQATKSSSRYNSRALECLLEQSQEHRLTSRDSHTKIAGKVGADVDPQERFNGEFASLDAQTLQRIKDRYATSCRMFDPAIVSP